MEILVLCGIYLMELVCYQLGLNALFGIRPNTRKWMFVGIFVPVIVGVLPIYVYGKNVIVAFGIFGIMFVSIEGRKTEKGVRLILVFLLLNCVNFVFARLCERLLLSIEEKFIVNVKYIAADCCTVMIIVIFNATRMKINRYKKTHISSAIYLYIGIMACLMMLCSIFLNDIRMFLSDNNLKIFSNMLSGAMGLSMLLLYGFLIYIKNTNERMEQLLKTEQLLKELQLNYYKQVLKKENDTRRYRHDMVNHLAYIQGVLNKSKVEDAKKYLANILGGFEKIQKTYLTVGNEVIDTIINYFFGELSGKATIDIRGKCPVVIDMEDTDICTIFSNIFQNALEEIKENEIENALIIIEAQKGIQYVEYTVKNSFVSKIEKENIGRNGFPKSHKSDIGNHGIGMMNVKETIERSEGKLNWFLEDGFFCVNVILPIKMSENN